MVDDEVISQRDILVSAYMNIAMDSQKKLPAQLALTPSEISKELNNLLVELMVDQETPFISPDETEKKSLETLWKRLSTEPFAQKVSLKEKDVETIYLRKKRVGSFIDLKISTLVQTPSPEEIKSYFERNKSKFGNTPLDQVSDNIKTFLMQNQRDAKLKAWYEGLRKKYRAQNYIAEKKDK